MKSILTTIIFCTALFSKSQTTLFEIKNSKQQTIFKITDWDAHYHSGVAISGWASSSFYFLKNRPLLASIVGPLVGTAVGAAKEIIWDGYFHNGVKSLQDGVYTGAGAWVVMLHFNIYVMSAPVRDDKKDPKNIDKLAFENLKP